jgi:hypothetical protein
MTATSRHLGPSRPVQARATSTAERLRADGGQLARTATAAAVTRVRPLLEGGRFRRPAAPRVETHLPPDADPVALRVVWDRNDADRWPPATRFAGRPTSPWWRTDEEETGWPTASIDVLVTPHDDGALLTALVDRSPGYDRSTNRIDKHDRDRVAHAAIEGFVDTLASLLSADPDRS